MYYLFTAYVVTVGQQTDIKVGVQQQQSRSTLGRQSRSTPRQQNGLRLSHESRSTL